MSRIGGADLGPPQDEYQSKFSTQVAAAGDLSMARRVTRRWPWGRQFEARTPLCCRPACREGTANVSCHRGGAPAIVYMAVRKLAPRSLVTHTQVIGMMETFSLAQTAPAHD